MKKKIVSVAVIAIAFVAVVLLCVKFKNNTTETGFFAMNTVCSLKINGKENDAVSKVIQAMVENLDTAILSRKNENSEVSRLNGNSGGNIDKKLHGWFSVLLDVCKKSEGKFDFTLGAVSDLWNFGGEARLPDSVLIEEALSHAGAEKIVLENNSVYYGDSFTVDFGAAGKGIALDEIKNYLDATQTKDAVVSIGGSILLYGEKDFTVGIRNPEGNAGSHIAVLKVDGCCVSTSGGYERFFEKDGKTYHHILDPDTGYPSESGVVSVTVVSQSGILSDALSTACFVLGIEKGSALAEEYGCETVFIDENKCLHVSEGLKNKIEISDNSYSFAEQ